jgi:hypothetical protein
MSIGQIEQLRGSDYADHCIVIEKDFPVKIGFGTDIFPPRVMRKIDDIRNNA